MADTFWPIYRSLEREVETVLAYTHCVDRQLGVYSIKNAELITRAVIEIEALSKKLFDRYGGVRRTARAGHQIPPKFDEECLIFLDEKWNLSEKLVIFTAPTAHIGDPSSKPLKTKEISVNGRIRHTYDWNIAYQSLKHDREESLESATLGNLIDAMKVLYLLNIYNRSVIVTLQPQEQSADADAAFGSILFSVGIHPQNSIGASGQYHFDENFDECAYLARPREPIASRLRQSLLKQSRNQPLTHEDKSVMKNIQFELIANKKPNYLKKGERVTEDGNKSFAFHNILSVSLHNALSQNPPSEKLSIDDLSTLAARIESDLQGHYYPIFGPGATTRAQLGVYLVEMGLANEEIIAWVTQEIQSAV